VEIDGNSDVRDNAAVATQASILAEASEESAFVIVFPLAPTPIICSERTKAGVWR
jgi:hypothetical protein